MSRVNIVGAGPAGALTALLLARRGFEVAVYERRDDPRRGAAERGRSINLALAARGIRALERAGVMSAVAPLLVPMRGRCLHERDGSASLLPYGQDEREVIHSVSRATLTRALIEAADRHPNVTLHFGTAACGVRTAAGRLLLRGEAGEEASGEVREIPLERTIGADGGGSALRASLAASGALAFREEMLDHDYKELTIAALPGGGFALERAALHIWPRGGFMLIALPNADGSFTATLFLARTAAAGTPSFAALANDAAVRSFFAREFPDALALMPDLPEQFRLHPQGRLGTVYTDRWHVGGQLLLIGDAAHAIVPFHGQGMNCAFEDCVVLDELVGRGGDWATLFGQFQHARQPNADAIARMALENYVEMRDSVRDPGFVRRKALSLELERRFPARFIPRYSMVMFHPEIAYAEAERRGRIQQSLLDELDAAAQAGARPDEAALRALIEARLPLLPCQVS